MSWGLRPRPTDVRANAAPEARAKKVDLVVANDVAAPGAGFEHDTNRVLIIGTDGREVDIPLSDKRDIARAILDVVATTERHRAVRTYTFTSESVTEGHPDKMADQISDAVLDAILDKDPMGRVACETLLTTGLVVVAGEITTEAYIDIPKLVRQVVCDIGYDRESSASTATPAA